MPTHNLHTYYVILFIQCLNHALSARHAAVTAIGTIYKQIRRYRHTVDYHQQQYFVSCTVYYLFIIVIIHIILNNINIY